MVLFGRVLCEVDYGVLRGIRLKEQLGSDELGCICFDCKQNWEKILHP